MAHSPGKMLQLALNRPVWYHSAAEHTQWEIDKDLGILDWDGSCRHRQGQLCEECSSLYWRTHQRYQIGGGYARHSEKQETDKGFCPDIPIIKSAS